MTGHSVFWFWRPIFQALGILLLGIIFLLTLTGAVLFWTPQFAAIFINNNHSDLNQLQLAQSGLKNTKRMVGDQQVWSEAIKEEYNQLFAVQPNNPVVAKPTQTQFPTPSYTNNFVELKYSINQVQTR